MKKVLFSAILTFLGFWSFAFVYAAEDKTDVGRYSISTITLDEKPMLVLLDTKTGRVWMYQKALSGGVQMTEEKFRGITVEGLAYSLNDTKKLDQQLNDFIVRDIITKDETVKGLTETLLGEFSYGLDVKKLKMLNYELQLEQAAKKKEQN
ncbi:MAG: hypothetical protein PHQ96_06380 [Candidatus Omnitrophica bacterium]|nr:hypothetical protein [Candidatus Omnitrophota bacterium]